jgi:hypothetical protein
MLWAPRLPPKTSSSGRSASRFRAARAVSLRAISSSARTGYPVTTALPGKYGATSGNETATAVASRLVQRIAWPGVRSGR